jgi:site-specific recombinase XerD
MNDLTIKIDDRQSEAYLFLSQFKPREIEGKKLGNINTFRQYSRGISILVEFMVAHDIKSINEINLKSLIQLQDDLLAAYSPKTVQVYLGVIKEFFYYLQNKGLLSTNDFANLRIIAIDKREAKTPCLTESEAARVMSHVMALPDTPNKIIDKLMMLIFLNTGVREEEITLIKIGDMKLSNKHLTILINGKGMRKRHVVLSPEVTSAVISLRNKLENSLMAPLGDNDYLLQSMANNTKGKNLKPISRVAVSQRVQKISQDLDLYFTCHALRRTFATILYKRNTPIEVIQRIMGHESATTTQGYINMEVDKEVGKKYATSMVG